MPLIPAKPDPIALTGAGVDDRHGWAELLAGLDRLSLDGLRAAVGVSADAELVVVAAHPDDETIGLGRLVARWARHGGPASTLLCTDGEACFDAVLPRPPALAERRVSEWERATDVLGIARRRRLGLPDGRLTAHEDRLRDALERAFDALGDRPCVVAHPLADDPHPDHAAAGVVAGRVATERGLASIGYPVWLPYWCRADAVDTTARRLVVIETDTTDDRAFELACACYPSQLEPVAGGFGPVVPPDLLARHTVQLVGLGRRGGAASS